MMLIMFLMELFYDFLMLWQGLVRKPVETMMKKMYQGSIISIDEYDLDKKAVSNVSTISGLQHVLNLITYLIWGPLKRMNAMVIDDVTVHESRNVIYDVKTLDKSFLTRGPFKVSSGPPSYERLPLTDVKHRDPFMMVIGSDRHDFTTFMNEHGDTVAKGEFTARELYLVACLALNIKCVEAEAEVSKLDFYVDMDPLTFKEDEKVEL